MSPLGLIDTSGRFLKDKSADVRLAFHLMSESNWAGNYSYRADRLHRPSSLEQVQEIIGNAPRVRVLGSRHSFTDIADSSELLTLDDLPPDVVVDHAAGTVSFCAGMKYGDLIGALKAEGIALANLASLPHISVAGAVATATHGSGDGNGNLASSVAGLEMVTSSGEILEILDPSVRPQIRSANTSGGHADNRVSRIEDLWVGALLDAHVAGGHT